MREAVRNEITTSAGPKKGLCECGAQIEVKVLKSLRQVRGGDQFEHQVTGVVAQVVGVFADRIMLKPLWANRGLRVRRGDKWTEL